MSRQQLAKRFNSAEYKDDALTLIRTNPDAAAQTMTKLARSKNAAEGELTTGTRTAQEVGAGILGLGTMFPVGMMIGAQEEKAEAYQLDWELAGAKRLNVSLEQYPSPWDHPEGVRDPRKILNFMPKTLAVAGGFFIASVVAGAVSKRKADNFMYRWMRNSSLMTLGTWIASGGSDVGRSRARRKMETPAQQAA